MTKSMPATDFRAVRHILEPRDWAVGGADVPPTNLIKKKIWHGIMNLPDTIAVLISDHNGDRFELLYELWGEWIEAIGTPGQEDELYVCMLDAADCFKCSNFDFLHGFYRSALANLRVALELVLIGTCGNLNPQNPKFRRWKDGEAELGFTAMRKHLLELLKGHPAAEMLEDNAFLAQMYRALCRYTHSRPGSGDGDLWKSTGPVYKQEAIDLTFHMTLRVYATCYLLVRFARSAFQLAETSDTLYGLDWLPDHAELSKAQRILRTG
jgi:hypothetical protein